MIGLAGLFLLLSYQNLYFGLDQLSGGNNGYWSLLIPGKFVPGVAKDGGPASSSSGQPTAAQKAFLGIGGSSSAATTAGTGSKGQTGGLGVPGVTGR